MKSSKTFREELKSVGGIPGVMYTQEEAARTRPPVWRVTDYDLGCLPEACGPSDDLCRIDADPAADAADEGLLFSEKLSFPEYGYEAARFDSEELDKTKTLADIFAEKLDLDVEAAVSACGEEADALRARIAAATATLGTDAFASYHPWHQYANSQTTPWGMWFHLGPLCDFAKLLRLRAQDLGWQLDASDAFMLGCMASYRHEQFHYHVERFALRLEVLLRRPFYRPYTERVYGHPEIVNTEDWLEEALAQAVTLESRWLTNRRPKHLEEKAVKRLLACTFRDFGGGYRDFDCSKNGGPENAHCVLAFQVASAERKPTMASTEAFTPKLEYNVSPESVPGYLVYSPAFAKRFQLAVPEYRRWERYARKNGYVFEKNGPGDHEIWSRNGQRVQVNTRQKDCDLASMKEVARMEGRPIGKLIEAIRRS